jgi:CheY-like chemotaxis protein
MEANKNTESRTEDWHPRQDGWLGGQRALRLQILVVGDQPATADTTFSLRLDGHVVRMVRDGPSALATARTHSPDVVVLDVDLLGLEGWQAAQQLWAQQTPRKPLMIAVARFGQEFENRRSQEAGIHLHLVKPVDTDFLRQLLRRFQDVVLPEDRSRS